MLGEVVEAGGGGGGVEKEDKRTVRCESGVRVCEWHSLISLDFSFTGRSFGISPARCGRIWVRPQDWPSSQGKNVGDGRCGRVPLLLSEAR